MAQCVWLCVCVSMCMRTSEHVCAGFGFVCVCVCLNEFVCVCVCMNLLWYFLLLYYLDSVCV